MAVKLKANRYSQRIKKKQKPTRWLAAVCLSAADRYAAETWLQHKRQTCLYEQEPALCPAAHKPDSSVAGEEAASLLSRGKAEYEADPLLIWEDDESKPVSFLSQEGEQETDPVLSLRQAQKEKASHTLSQVKEKEVHRNVPQLSPGKVEEEEAAFPLKSWIETQVDKTTQSASADGYSLGLDEDANGLEEGPVQTNSIHLQPTRHLCQICGEIFYQEDLLLMHKQIHVLPHPHMCGVCGKCFSQHTSLRRHENIHTQSHRFTCVLCGKVFGRKDHLDKHSRIHAKEWASYNIANDQVLPMKYSPLRRKLLHTQACPPTYEVHSQESPRLIHTPDSSVAGEEATSLQSQTEEEEEVVDFLLIDEDDESEPLTSLRPLDKEATSPLVSQVIVEEEDSLALCSSVNVELENSPAEFASDSEDSSDGWTLVPGGAYKVRKEKDYLGKGPSHVLLSPPAKTISAQPRRKLHKCEICGKDFSRKDRLRLHKQMHSGARHFACEMCGKVFLQRKQMLLHKEGHTVPWRFPCDLCGKGFNQKGKLHEHKEIHRKERPFSCGICGKSFTRKMYMRQHMQVHTSARPFACDVCGKSYKRKEYLLCHKLIHKDRLSSSEACQKTFVQKNILLSKQVRSEGPRSADPCSMESSWPAHTPDSSAAGEEAASLLSHMEEESEGPSCVLLRAAAQTSSVQPQQKLHKCQFCSKKFTRKDNLNVHERIHTGVRPFSCEICGKWFITERQMLIHKSGHTRNWLFLCEFCGRGFCQKGRLLKHRRIHSAICGKSFTKQMYMHQDRQMHTDACSFTCDICGKGFHQKEHLLNHKFVHSMDGLSSSAACGKSVLKKIRLQNKQVHTEDGPSSREAGRLETFRPAHTPDGSLAREEAASLLSEVKMEDDEVDPFLVQEDEADEREPVDLESEQDKEIGPVPLLIQDADTLHNWVSVKGFDSLLSLVEETEPVSSLSQEAEHWTDPLPSRRQADEATSPVLSLVKVEEDDHVALLSRVSVELEESPAAFAGATECNSPSDAQFREPAQPQQELHECEFCGKSYTRKHYLCLHQRLHTGDRPYSCRICGEVFTWKRQTKDHMAGHTGMWLFSCEFCGKGFNQKSRLLQHKTIHNRVRPYICDVCGKDFARNTQLLIHKAGHTVPWRFPCDLCGMGFNQKGKLLKHKEIHRRERPFSCGICGMSFTRKTYMRQHMQVHTGARPFACDVCDKSYTRKHHLINHMLIHEDGLSSGASGMTIQKDILQNKPVHREGFPSPCNIQTSRPLQKPNSSVAGEEAAALLNQVKVEDEGEPLLAQADYAREPVPSLSQAEPGEAAPLQRWIKVEEEEDPFALLSCVNVELEEGPAVSAGAGEGRSCNLVPGEAYKLHEEKDCFGEDTSAWHLSTPEQTSSDQPLKKLHKCEFCGKDFKRKDNMAVHLRIHTGLRPYSCGLCGKSFTQRVHLRGHERIHTGERPYPCDICGHRFPRRDHMFIHKRKHFMASLFCQICGRKFKDANNLAQHMQEHPTDRPFPCDICGKSYKKKDQLLEHRLSHAVASTPSVVCINGVSQGPSQTCPHLP